MNGVAKDISSTISRPKTVSHIWTRNMREL